MALTRKEVEDIALLARLHLEPDELERMQSDLGVILEHFGTIASIDTTGITPLTHAVTSARPTDARPTEARPTDTQLRPDVPQPPLPVELALAQVPRRDGDLIVVPAIIPGGGG